MMIQVQDVSKTYLQGTTQIHALDQVSFSLSEGKSLAIVGPSGSGKTTLLSLLAGLDKPDSGSLQIAAVNMRELSEAQLARFRGETIGIVFQQFHLMPHLTALENVALPLEILGQPLAEQRAREALDKVGLATRAKHFPSQLSGGECQRVAIARAFVVKPKVLLADEPSGSLDNQTGEKVMDLLFSLCREFKTTLVVITHDPKLAQRCDEKIELHGGKRL
jgi:putative ABC transport system ATP-binding protein